MEVTDLEITNLCAEAIGMRNFQSFPLGDYPDQDGTFDVSGGFVYHLRGNPHGGYNRYPYDPLHDDAQAMALVKQFPIQCIGAMWEAVKSHNPTTQRFDLNRAICECVANMQKGKNGAN